MSGVRTVSSAASDNGGVGLTVVGAGLAFWWVGLVLLGCVVDLGVASARARTAADAAALAAMSTSPLVGGDGQPDGPASALARANGAEIVSTDRSQWPLQIAVEVRVAPTVALVRRVVGPVRARAAAIAVPDPAVGWTTGTDAGAAPAVPP